MNNFVTFNNEENIIIDTDAKTKVELTKIDADKNGQPYYIGKIQFPGNLQFDKGISFMAFISDDGVEQLQISPLDTSRLKVSKRTPVITKDRVCIVMYPLTDSKNKTYYVGEAVGPFSMDLRSGIFFTLFVSKAGLEELQISKLQHKPREKSTSDIISEYVGELIT